MKTNCVNKNLPEFKALQESTGIHPLVLAAKVSVWQNIAGTDSFPTAEDLLDNVNYNLKAVDILVSDKAEQVFTKGIKNKWSLNKVLTELQVPKEQKEIINNKIDTELGFTVSRYSYGNENVVQYNRPDGYELSEKEWINRHKLTDNLREDIIMSLLADNSFVVKVNTAKGNRIIKPPTPNLDGTTNEMEIYEDNNNSSYYSNLTVPGGTNYTENEISTPDITPNIKGHAQFSTDNGIGWFRSDDRTTEYKGKEDLNNFIIEIGEYGYLDNVGDTDTGRYARYKKDENDDYTDYIDNITEEQFNNLIGVKSTKTRRILEVQSDLFQKGRDKKELVIGGSGTIHGSSFISGNWEYEYDEVYNDYAKREKGTKNQFKDITKEEFDRAYKTREINNNTQQNQFLQLLNKKGNWINFFVQSIVQDSIKKGYKKVLFPTGETAAKVEGHDILAERLERDTKKIKEYKELLKAPFEKRTVDESLGRPLSDEFLNEQIKDLEADLKTLKEDGIEKLAPIEAFYGKRVTNILKKNYPITEITDEHGNTWNQVDLTDDKLKDQVRTIQLAKDFEIKKALSERIENAHEKFFSKIDSVDEKYMDYLGKRSRDNISTTEAKIKRLQEAFDAVVVIDTSLDYSGALLGSNHPLTKANEKPTIVINPNRLFSDTVIHEFGHLYIDMLGGMQDPIVQDAVELLKGSTLWNTIEEQYPELNGEDLAKEVVATALGIEGDKIFKDNEENKTLWNRIREAILNAINKLFGYKQSSTALGQLANEMLTNNLRTNSSAKFNTLIDQLSKLKIDNPTQENIDKRFKELEERFKLDEESHTYKDNETGEVLTSSVSQFAKNISKGFINTRKGSWNIEFDESYELTEDNFVSIITKAKLPYALDKALDDLFKGQIPGSNVLFTIDQDVYWHSHYTNRRTIDEFDASMLDNTIKDNIDILNAWAYEKQKLKDIPLIAGNIIHNALEDYIKNGDEFPARLVDRSGKLLPTIKSIIDEGHKKGSKFYTEQMLFSESAKKPGTADLIEITKDGKFKIYDYKTMTSFENYKTGNPKSEYEMYIGNGYLNQILIYSTILEEYGLTPADGHLNIIAIEVDRKALETGDENAQVIVTDLINKNIKPSDKKFNVHINKAKATITSVFKNPEKLKGFDFKTEEKTIENLVEKIQAGITDYQKLTNPYSGKFTRGNLPESAYINKIDDDIKKLDAVNNKVAILSYINNIREALYSVYNNNSLSGENTSQQDITPEYLGNLEFLLQTTSFMKDVKEFITSKQEDFIIEDKDKQDLLFLINETETVLAQVRNFADLKMREEMVSSFAMNSNFIEGVWQEKFEIEARKLGKKNKEDIEKYIHDKLIENKDEIQSKEYEYWNELLNNGYTDLRPLEYFMADPGMSKSQFVQVTKNIIDKVDQDVRTDLDREVADLVNWHSNLKMKTDGDPKKVWGKFIEEGSYEDLSGKTQKYLHSSVIPEFTSEYREVYVKYKNQLDYLRREILKEKNQKKKQVLIDKVEYVKLDMKVDLEAASKNKKIHPKFNKLTKDEKEALRFIHKKLKDADDRLFDAPYKKLIKETRDGTLIYNLPRKRMSSLESAYSASNTWERFKSGLNEFITPAKDEDELNISENEDRELADFKTNNTDILGNPLYDIPIYYRNELEDPTLQSFDIPTLLALNDETTIMYQNHKMIEADLFMITNSLKNSKALKTDSVVSRNITDFVANKYPKTLKSEDNKTFKAVQASINNRFYKRTYSGIYSKTNYQFIKGAESISKATSAILLAGNFGSASMTGIQGSIYRLIEGAAGEDFNMNDVKMGSKKAWIDVNNVIADSQKQFPTSKTALLIRRFGLETQYKALVNKFVQSNFVTKNLDEGALFTITTIAETMVTANLMYTLMNNIKVMNSKGDYIDHNGKVVKDKKKAMSLDEAYKVENGKLILHKDVYYTEKNLVSAFKNNIEGEKTIAATEISRFIRSKYADLYGQYNQDMKSVAEMHVIGKLVFSMRKWIPRGYHRRLRGLNSVTKTFDEMKYDENLALRFFSQDQKKLQEGYYTTGFRYMVTLYKEIDRKKLNFMSTMKDINSKLTTHERANLKRSAFEIAIIALSATGALLLQSIALGMDDDDDKSKDSIYFAAYLAERIKIESLTFINPFELMDNIKNPAASVNTLNRIQKLLWNLVGVSYNKELEAYDFEIDNVYDNGPREGELKLWRNISGLIPYYKKVQQAKGIFGLDSKESIADSYQYLIR